MLTIDKTYRCDDEHKIDSIVTEQFVMLCTCMNVHNTCTHTYTPTH